jgi:hypothetical protein
MLKIWKNYITELYDPANGPENLKVETKEEVDEDERGPQYFTQRSGWEGGY